MNLIQMADQVCADTGYLDVDDVAYAKLALRQRDDFLWRVGLWKDALVQVTVAVDPVNNADHAAGVIYLPEVIERVVGVRTADAFMRVSGLETFYRVDFDKFAQTGSPVEFAKLHPAWFTWRPTTAHPYLQVAGETGDASALLKLIWLDGETRRLTTNTTVGAAAVLRPTLADSLTLLSAYKPATLGSVELALVDSFPAENLGDYFNIGGGRSATAGIVLSGTYLYTPGNERKFSIGTDNPAFAAGEFVAAGETYQCVSDITAIGSPCTAIVRLKDILTPVATLPATDTKAPTYQRIRIFPIPKAAGSIKVLGKANYEPLDFDEMEPAITGSHLALMAFAKHLLYKRGGETGPAGEALQEAMGLVEVLKREELQQEANNQRIIPDSGFGDVFFGPGRDGYFLGG